MKISKIWLLFVGIAALVTACGSGGSGGVKDACNIINGTWKGNIDPFSSINLGISSNNIQNPSTNISFNYSGNQVNGGYLTNLKCDNSGSSITGYSNNFSMDFANGIHIDGSLSDSNTMQATISYQSQKSSGTLKKQ